MAKSKTMRPPCTVQEQQLIIDNEYVIHNIAKRLQKSFYWMCWDDLNSYGWSALVIAAIKYDPKKQKPDKTFETYASQVGFFLAVDEMRSDGVICRNQPKKPPHKILSEK